MAANTKVIFVFFIILISTLLGCKEDGCEEDDNVIDKVNITVCNTKNPKWLIDEISLKLNRTSTYIPIRVFHRNDDDEIILIEDPTNSNWAEAYSFFDCSGNKIEFNSTKYNQYLRQYHEGKFTLLWPN